MLLSKLKRFEGLTSGRVVLLLYALIVALLAVAFLHGYLSQFVGIGLMGVLGVSVYIHPADRARMNSLLLLLSLFLFLSFLVPVKTFLYYAMGLALFVMVKQRWGLRLLPALITLFLSSPAFQYVVSSFSFPIRLQLTKWVAAIFHSLDKKVVVQGNSILYNGIDFSVDPACMGLHMLTISLLFGIILIGLVQKRAALRLSNFYFATFLLLMFLLNVIANLLRMVLLIEFAILPEHPLHEIVGLVCFGVYVCLPAVWLAVKAVRHFGKPSSDALPAQNALPTVILLTIVTLLLICALRVQRKDTFAPFEKAYSCAVPGYTTALHSPGIIKLTNENSLLYVKFIRGFYDTEHNPTICWKGSGYEFEGVTEISVQGRPVYTARLVKGAEQLYTAWYYSNGEKVTTSQWAWRNDLLLGARPYAVLNVSAESKELLMQELSVLFKEAPLNTVFNKLSSKN